LVLAAIVAESTNTDARSGPSLVPEGERDGTAVLVREAGEDVAGPGGRPGSSARLPPGGMGT
jgi:hypothetical protein